MGTAEIKAELAARYPGLKFARRSKVKDRLGYTHRVFEAPTKIVVVTCDAYEDEEVMEVNDIATIPSSMDLKDYLRPWNPLGPLSNYYFAFGEISDTTNTPILCVANKTVWDKSGYIDDSSLESPLISGLLGVSELMESVYETDFGLMSSETLALIGQFEVDSSNDDENDGQWLPPRPKIGSEDELRRLAISLGAIEKQEIADDEH